MAFLNRENVLERLRSMAFNSSHFVWLLADLEFYETSRGFVFGFHRRGDVILFAVEPLIPAAFASDAARIREAWDEACRELRPRTSVFVSVYSPFRDAMAEAGFQALRIGSEPWVRLAECMPTGNSGKGVRSARNQAIRAGLAVEEWAPRELRESPEKRAVLCAIHADWSLPRWFRLSGFTLSSDPFAYCEERRYFVLRSESGRVEAYLVASPVAARNSYYLEDMVIRRTAPKGSGELLSIEAMAALASAGFRDASLGVVGVSSLTAEDASGLPPLVRWLTVTLPQRLGSVYNFSGMETFRKRFKPYEWSPVFILVRNEASSGQSDTLAWLRALFALAVAFSPTLHLGPAYFFGRTRASIARYPLTWILGAITSGLFAAVNRFGSLPGWALDRFGFSAATPLWEWPMRSVLSDLLYLDPLHFVTCGLGTLALLAWTERVQKRRFLLPLVLITSLADDFVNYLCVTVPFGRLHPQLYDRLIDTKDVGGSLLLMVLLGVQITELRRKREIVFVACNTSLVLGLVLSASHLSHLVFNLNHFLFLSMGFVIGKVKFEYQRRKNQDASRSKGPVPAKLRPTGADARKKAA